jgi:hypothetical protein
VLLGGPTVLAFFSGGYFDEPRAWAGVGAWAIVVVGLLAVPRPLPRGRGSLLAVVGLTLLAGWTLLSITWAPIAGNAHHAGQLTLLYVGALLAAAMLLRVRVAERAVEPALALGASVVICYGISERLLPGLLHLHRSISAQGRLEQPLTYWNAMGELAALGFVLAARLAGDESRRRAVRAIAAGATAPLGMGLYLSFSRGSLFACGAGLVALAVLVPRRQQLAAAVISLLAGALAATAVSQLHSVTSLAGSLATRERQGAIALALLVLVTTGAGLAQRRVARRAGPRIVRLPPRAPLLATAVICGGLAVAIVLGAKERSGAPLSSGSTRLVTLQSNRYAYWRVALRAFRAHPVRGVGAGGWAVYWLRDRPFNDFAQDAHSLPLQTLAELGIVGLALLAAFLAGIGFAAREAFAVAPSASAGAAAGFVVWVAHAPLDWDWQMPAVTLVAIVLVGMLVALAQRETVRSSDSRYSASAIRGASRLKIHTEAAHTSR